MEEGNGEDRREEANKGCVKEQTLWKTGVQAYCIPFADAGTHVRAFLHEGQGSLSTYSLYPICHGGGLLHGAFTPWLWWSGPCVELNIPLLPEEASATSSCSTKSLVCIEIVNAKGIGAGLGYCLQHHPLTPSKLSRLSVDR